MSALFVLIGFSILVAAGFLIAFIWSVKNGQYEDEYTPSVRILFEDKVPEESDNNNINVTITKNSSNGN
ncbi:MAG: cbb3-type cytochrome oxidase assembly protein CcoS [Bacteroidetes bacterium]|nr:cbb3-type cytochrome oxidase assembly protein CcoS [Bacteroidota bacterium]|tara:strand:+ start:128 stop:334 length:207 start_codon:yes stop_codon:yes gene_type:complete